jgi:uncharacterized protein YndB with AHSA1/START domain
MVSVSRTIDATPEEVFTVLSDGWNFAAWVVGASRIRDVQGDWPSPGSCIHHSVGVWPLVLDDTTQVVSVRENSELLLRGRAWPAGEAEIRFRVRPDGHGSEVTIDEDAVAGPGSRIPRPVRAVLLKVRNQESLVRLAYIAESQKGRRQLGDTDRGA